jgi:renalase
MKANSETTDILIIGAGLSGLAAASKLKSMGLSPIIVDKGRGVGGRLANRRFDGAVFDHGAQFMTVRDDRFRKTVQTWIKEGIVSEWYRSYPGGSGENPRYRGNPAMTAIAKELAKEQELRLGAMVTSIEEAAESWKVTLENENVIIAKSVIMTPPVPQTLALLHGGKVSIPEPMKARLQSITYEKCFAVMALLDGPSEMTAPGILLPEHGPIAWMADNQLKGISALPAVTIHATATYSERNWERDRELVAQELVQAAQPHLKGTIIKHQIHGWRYSKPATTDKDACLVLRNNPCLVIAGDAFAGPRIEGAVLSGWAAAEALLQRTSEQ